MVHVDPDELVWVSEIAARTGSSRQSIDQLVRRQRGPGDYPPATHATRNPLWRGSDVEEWFAKYEGRQSEVDKPLLIGAINGALQARHALRGASEPKPLRRALQ